MGATLYLNNLDSFSGSGINYRSLIPHTCTVLGYIICTEILIRTAQNKYKITLKEQQYQDELEERRRRREAEMEEKEYRQQMELKERRHRLELEKLENEKKTVEKKSINRSTGEQAIADAVRTKQQTSTVPTDTVVRPAISVKPAKPTKRRKIDTKVIDVDAIIDNIVNGAG